MRVILHKDISVEESIVRELINGPISSNLVNVIPESLEILSVEAIDGTVYVNFSGEGMYGSSMQEYFTIEQIVASLFELDGIKSVQFLVNGEKVESLMGHIGVLEPFKK